MEILPGLTGIVGPNGCGKSNVVEALRWAMGESSARSLRGGEMDDLIFAGTAARPARNLAEVVLTLEGAAGLAPAPFHEQAELQISRRIERGAGSFYRLNGHELRARDVQTLFADLASGARSSAMVSQGRVAAIVNARPDERRSLLEEAAGITGLHARRHEAELKLRATESNLARADDLRAGLDARIGALAEQAAQAERYRTIAEELRRSETTLLALLHARARQAVLAGDRAVSTTAAAQDAATRELAAAEAAATAAEAGLQAPRDAEMRARLLLERRRTEAEAVGRDREQAVAAAAQAEARLEQAVLDRDEAATRSEDAEATAERLETEAASLDAAAATLPARHETADRELARHAAASQAAASASLLADEAAAQARMRHAEAVRDREAAAARLRRAEATLGQVEAELGAATAALPDPQRLEAGAAALATAAAEIEAATLALEAASGRQRGETLAMVSAAIAEAESRRRHQAAAEALADAELRATRLSGDRDALSERLAVAEARLLPEPALAADRDAVHLAEAGLAAAAATLDGAETRRAQAVSARLELTAQASEAGRARAQAELALRQAHGARQRAAAQHAALARDHAQAAAGLVPRHDVEAATAARLRAEAELDTSVAALAAAEAAQERAQASAAEADRAVSRLREAQGRLAAEVAGLTQALVPLPEAGSPEATAWTRLADLVEVPPELVAALAACLGDGLEAGLVDTAPADWRPLPECRLAPLPEPAMPLDRLIAMPAALHRAASQAGLVADDVDAAALQALLQPGQCLVTRAGGLWRWDGYRVRAGAPSQAALRLLQRSRLRAAHGQLADADAGLAPAQVQATARAERHDRSVDATRGARAARTLAEQVLSQARAAESRVGRRDAEARFRLDALGPELARATAALAEADGGQAAAQSECDGLPSASGLARACDAAAADEATATHAAVQAREALRGAEAALVQARDRAATRRAGHAESLALHDTLRPAQAGAADEASAALAALASARAGFAALEAGEGAPMRAAAMLRHRQDDAAAAERDEQAARDRLQAARQASAELARTQDRLVAAALEGRSRLDALEDRRRLALAEHTEAADATRAALAVVAALPDPGPLAGSAETARLALSEAGDAERGAAATRAALGAEQAALDARRAPLAAGLAEWRTRRTAAAASLQGAASRLERVRSAWTEDAAAPAAADRRAATAQATVVAATAAQDAAAALLRAAEASAQAALASLRACEGALGRAREARMRSEARSEQARAMLAQLLAETPQPPSLVPADLSDAAETGLRRRVAACLRERGEIGPVNLRADLELADARSQGAAIVSEYDELTAAIARLRGQIGHLNREGRERLTRVLTAVDGHFQALFSRMFGGGRAHLGLVGSDDPLSAGLEIYAQPPGKKLATLSLLSGGEQALTALSLIFAVFRCNPAPVCVLDEVDAPLDDANVDRFCALLADMAQEAGTRFLVVTHHQLTMAGMDRLYGVTMQERGVSRVLSVDLGRAVEMVG